MKVSIRTLLTLTLLVAITFQVGRVWWQCALLKIEIRSYKNQDENAVGNTLRKKAEIEVFENALSAESPTSLLQRARERHDALAHPAATSQSPLPSRPITSKPQLP